MKIRINAFGVSKDIIGKKAFELTVQSGSNVSDIRVLLATKFPGLKGLPTLMIAVNAKYASDDVIIQDTDMVALIPPTNGG